MHPRPVELFKATTAMPRMWEDTTISPAAHPVTEVAPTEVPKATRKDAVMGVMQDLPTPDPGLTSQWRSKASFDTSSTMHVVEKDAVVAVIDTPREESVPRYDTIAGGDVPGEPCAVSKVPRDISTMVQVDFAGQLPFFTCSAEGVTTGVPAKTTVTESADIVVEMLVDSKEERAFSRM